MGQANNNSKLDIDIEAIEEDLQEEIFYRPQRDPVIRFDSQLVEVSRQKQHSCLIGYMLDEKDMHNRRLQSILSNAWELHVNFSGVR